MTGRQPVAGINEGFSSPGATARPWAEPRCVLTTGTPEKVLAFGKGEPFSQTRYRF
jgi:hypothetical protein